ncbi:hypothetical protein V2W45_1231178, partial [Cenococcum geophilum]
NVTATTRKHGCDCTTLSRRFHRVTASAEGYDSMRLLGHARSEAFMKYVNDLIERGLLSIISILRNLAGGIIGRQA